MLIIGCLSMHVSLHRHTCNFELLLSLGPIARLSSDQVEIMDDVLRGTSQDEIKRLQDNIKCIWPKLFWSSVIGQLRDETSLDEVPWP